MTNKSLVREHMKRFRILASRRTNQHLIFLHVHCHMSLDLIAQATGISRKTVGRMVLGQLPTRRQLRLIQRTVLTAAIELEKLMSYERQSRTGMYYGQIIHHTVSLGRMLSRASKAPSTLAGKTRDGE